MELTAYQQKALGVKSPKNILSCLWNQRIAKLYSPIDKINLSLGDQGQTFAQFRDMEKRPPNFQGTGRYKFSHFESIELIFIPGKHSEPPKPQIKQFITTFLAAYLKITCQSNSKIKLVFNPKGVLEDRKKNLAYEIEIKKKKMDVHQLLSILLQYQTENKILVALVEHSLHEENEDVDGRAYGDGVAAVSYSSDDLQTNLQSYLQTILHETLHTLGFDHCLAWKCLMNGYTNFQSWLCPACSKKLYHELNLYSSTDIAGWMRPIIDIFAQLKARKSLSKGEKLLKYLMSQ